MKMRYGLLLTAFLSLSGCLSQSPDSRFYLLSAQAPRNPQVVQDYNLGVYLVNLAHYLDRQQLVSRRHESEIQIDEFQRWAGDHARNITRVLAENLGRLLGPAQVFAHPWPPGMHMDYQLNVNILRFDAGPGNTATLEAQWQLFDALQHVRIRRHQIFEQNMADTRTSTRIAAQNQLLVRLAQQIANDLPAQPLH